MKVNGVVSGCFSKHVCMFLGIAILYMSVFLPPTPHFFSIRFSKKNKMWYFLIYLFMFSFANSFAHSAIFIKHLLYTILHEHYKYRLRFVAWPQSLWETLRWLLNSFIDSSIILSLGGRGRWNVNKLIQELYFVYNFKVINILFCEYEVPICKF